MKPSWLKRVQSVSTRELNRYLWITGAIFATSALLFSGYYYFDRYGRYSSQSIVDTGIQQLEKSVRDAPDAPEPRVALAEYYLDKNQCAKAADQVSQVLENFPDNQAALLIAGKAYTQLGRAQDAIPKLEALIKIRNDAKSADHSILEAAYFYLGKSYNAVGQHDKALTVLEYALKFTPTDADALYEAGVASQATKQSEKAVGYYSKAAWLVPDFRDAYSGLIESYTSLNQPDYVAYARGMQAFTLGDYQTAQVHLTYAARILTKYAPAYYGLALVYEKEKRYQEAYDAINAAAQLDPTNVAIVQVLGRLKNSVRMQS